MPARAPTLQTIADHIGCSKNTVSCALRNDSRISDRMKAEVRRVAKELGYRPNPLVSAHMQSLRKSHPAKQSATLAFLHTGVESDLWSRRKFSAELFRGASERASELGYHLTPVWAAEPGISGERLGAILQARGVLGLLVPLVEDPQALKGLNWDEFASAAMGFSLTEPALHSAATFYLHAIPDAGRMLMRAGNKRLGILFSPRLDARFDHAWEAGSAIAIRQCRDLKIPVTVLRKDYITPKALRNWLLRHRIEGLISVGNTNIFLAISDIRDDLPASFRHLSVLADEPEKTAGHVWGIYDRDLTGIGAASVDLVVGQLYRNERGIPLKRKTLLIEGEWRINEV